MANPFFSGRIPNELYTQIEQHMAKTGERKTDVLIRALSAYVKYELPITPTAAQADALEKLQQRVTAMELGLEERIRAAVEQFIQSLPKQKQKTLNKGQLELLEPNDNKDIDGDNIASDGSKETTLDRGSPEPSDNKPDNQEPSESDTENDNGDNQSPEESSERLSTGKVAKLVGIPASTLRDSKAKGKLPIHRNGYRIDLLEKTSRGCYWKVIRVSDNN